MSGRQQIANIQILRGVAALLVVVCHAVYSTWMFDRSFTLGGNLDDFGPVGVDLFFVISGFIIAHTSFVHGRREPIEFIRQRLWRVAPLYFLLGLPWLAMAAYAGPLDGGKLLASLTFWPATDTINMPYLGVGWTLSFEMLFYAAAALCLWLPGRGIVVALLLAYGLCWFGATQTGAAALIFLGNPIIIEFLMGMLIAHIAQRPMPVLGAAMLAVGTLILLATLLGGYGGIHNAFGTINGRYALSRMLFWGVPCACIVLGAVLMCNWLPDRLARPLRALGDASYSIYLVHLLALLGLERALQLTGMAIPAPLIFCAGVALSVIAGLLTYRFIERPLLRSARRPAMQLAPA